MSRTLRPLTLRLRLVVALVILVAAGLGLFGVVTYSLYDHSQFQALDSQLRTDEPLADAQLDQYAGLSQGDNDDQQPQGPGGSGPPDQGPGQQHGPPVVVPPGTYAVLRSASGKVLSHIATTANALPRLPASLGTVPSGGRFFTVPAASGGGSFRVLAQPAGIEPGAVVLLAVPTSVVTSRLHSLVLIELVGAAGLLVLLSVGASLILRRGLHPLERMADAARSINAGDLSRRVASSGGAAEVSQLGLALNTMLDDIEVAFQDREATEQRLRQFLADASHELRTPLTSIQGFAELFRISGDTARVDLPTILRRIEEESARMKFLVEDLLLLARLDQTRVAQREPVDLAVLAADACSDIVATATDRPVTLDAPEPVVVAGDEAHLRQALANLTTNAVRHTPPGSRIEVTARLVGGRAEVSVRDHGPGLDEAALAHAFDRFWQADKGRSGASAGLGLAIVAGIAAEHGGRVSAANAADGGAVFCLQLPLTDGGGVLEAPDQGQVQEPRPSLHQSSPG